MTLPPPPMLEARGVAYRHDGDFALKDITFELVPGQVMCILGANGSGKTTLYSVLTTGLAPMAGEVYLNGINAHQFVGRSNANLVAMPFMMPFNSMNTPYVFWRTYGARYGMSRKYIAERLAELAPAMHMDKPMHLNHDRLSLGMKQKAALVAAFLPEVFLRVIDEPFSGGIDPLAMECLIEWITAARARGETIVFTSQHIEHAERLADKVLILNQGRIAALGSPAEIVAQMGLSPDEPRAFAQAYIEATESS